MPELLLELLSEEIPARMQRRAADDLKRLVTRGLADAGLEFDQARAFSTPRRLVLVVDGLPETRPDVTEERKGPRVGAPEQAIQGFLKSAGLDSLDQCEKREVKGNEFYFLASETKGGPTIEVLPEVIFHSLSKLSWPKSMVWAEGKFRWIRPLHSVMALFDDSPLGLREYHEGLDNIVFPSGVEFDEARTHGHRFLAPAPFEVTDFADYQKKLEAAFVMLDPAARRETIEREAARLAEAESLTLRDDPGLLDEVAGLVEWPVVLIGTIDEAFMDLPPEVLVSAMRTHQKYFALEDGDGNMAARFIVVANIETADKGKAIVAGNERVLRARLSDAKFFWDQDRKATLQSRVPALNAVVWHEKLGSIGDKVDRVAALAVAIAANVPGADKDRVRSAARLCKADLVSGMVGEFPELQGIMGRWYALADGEHAEVADAIADHYAPQGPSDRCPTAPVPVALALADRIDTLAGFWAIDEKPTGSRDPFALRRAALGVIRLVLENRLRLSLTEVFREALKGYGKDAAKDESAVDLMEFFADRLKVHLRDAGVRHDHVDAVFGVGGQDDLVRLLARVKSLAKFLDSDDGANLLVAYRRAANIVRIEEKKDGVSYTGAPEVVLLKASGEEALNTALTAVAEGSSEALDEEDFEAAMSEMAKLRGPVDAFFDEVTVNADQPELRVNRLRLLAAIRDTMDAVADFSQIEGGGGK